MITSTAESMSSAVAYLSSKESEIETTAFERMAAANKLAIQRGKVSGLTFPAPRIKMGRGAKFRTPRHERISKVNEINELRKTGVNAKEASEECNLSYSVYRHWSDDLGIEFNYSARWGYTNL